MILQPQVLLAQARPGVDSSGVQILLGNPQLDCSLAAMRTICKAIEDQKAIGSSSGLGNRIGTFSVTWGQTGYVQSRACFLGANSSNDEASNRFVKPIAGPAADGTFTWQIHADNEATASANCYFQSSTPGIFSNAPFADASNIERITSAVFQRPGGTRNICLEWGLVPVGNGDSEIGCISPATEYYVQLGEQKVDRQLSSTTGEFTILATYAPASWNDDPTTRHVPKPSSDSRP